MELTKDNILLASNHGLNFYQLVLQEQLVIKGNRSKVFKNPFYKDTKADLSIYYRDGHWLFKDFGDPSYSGDVFHFAAYYYNLDSKNDFFEILKRMNQDLSLGLIEKTKDSKLQNQINAIIRNSKRDAIAFMKGRGLTKAQFFYQSDAYGDWPTSVVFLNHNKTGYEKRFCLSSDELNTRSMPKTMYYGTKRQTVYDATFDKNKENVFICEGVINALSFAEIGESAIATFGVGNIPEASLLKKYIQGKTVYLAGDGDEAGKIFNQNIKKLIEAANIKVLNLYIVEFPDHKDANDLILIRELNQFNDLRKIQFLLYDFSKVLNFNNYCEIFPLEVFTSSMQNLIKELNYSLNFPINYTAAAILSAVSISVGKTMQMKVQNGWFEYGLLYMILSGRAGINKSHPLTFSLKPVLKHDELKKQEYDLAYNQYEDLIDLSLKEKRELNLEDVKEPKLKQILVSDITPESLQSVHSNNPRGLGLYRDEILGWINSFDRYSNSGELQMWLSIWSSIEARTNRSGRRPIYLNSPFVSIVGTIQNARLPDLNKGNLCSTGFTDRILYTFAEDNNKKYLNDSELSDSYITYYHNQINKLLNLPVEVNEQQQVESRVLSFSKSARKVFLDWNKYNADLSNAKFTTELQRSIYAKLDSYLPRFILLLQMQHKGHRYAIFLLKN